MRRSHHRLLGIAAGAAAMALACGTGARAPAVGPAGDVASMAGLPWELPAAALGTQRLYRASYDGPEGDGSFRATLRLAAPDRFELAVADRLGRPLYALRVEGTEGWWLDQRRDLVCRDLSRLELPGLEAGPVEARALPRLLLGRLPATPSGAGQRGIGAPEAGGSGAEPALAADLEVRDVTGRRWTASRDRAGLVHWALRDAVGEAVWWWQRDRRGGVLSGREGRRLQWQEVVVEPLAALPPGRVPAGVEERCETPPLG